MPNLRDQIAADAATCPPGVSFAKDIAPLFNQTDIDHMKQVTKGSLDLSVYNDVKIYSSQIYSRVSTGDMPPPPSAAWTPPMVQLFACWIQQGTQP
jgi:hypothetical protein